MNFQQWIDYINLKWVWSFPINWNIFQICSCMYSVLVVYRRGGQQALKKITLFYINLTSLSDRLSSSRFSLSCSSRGYFKHGKSTTGHFMLRKSSFCCHLAWLAACAPEKRFVGRSIITIVYSTHHSYIANFNGEKIVLQPQKYSFVIAVTLNLLHCNNGYWYISTRAD